MAREIGTVPEDFKYPGEDHDYSHWAPGTRLRLTNVPWSADYRDIAAFETEQKLIEFLELGGPTDVTITKATYARIGDPVKVALPFSKACGYNYLMVSNNAQGTPNDKAQNFYYFITDVKHLNAATTILYVQLDVWQTFGRQVHFGRGFVERGHLGMVNTEANNDNRRLHLTEPEGLEVGSDYVIRNSINKPLDSKLESQTNQFVIVSAVKLDGEFGTVSNPVLQSANGSLVNSMVSGCEIYVVDSDSELVTLLSELHDKPWISQGIISIYALPFKVKRTTVAKNIGAAKIYEIATDTRTGWDINFGNYQNILTNAIPAPYRRFEKFKTGPYTMFEFTCYNGQPLVVRPETIMTDGDIIMRVEAWAGQPSPRIAMYIDRHNAYDTRGKPSYHWYDNLDAAINITNFPQLPVVNDGYMSYMASNANSIAYQYSSAEWGMNKAMKAASVGFSQATAGMQLNTQLNSIGVNQANQMRDLQNFTGGIKTMTSAASSVIGGAMGGGWAGLAGGALNAAAGVANYGADVHNNNQSTAISNAANTARTGAQNDNAAYIRDTNKAYADFAAQGDYQNTIEGINAKTNDAKVIQPTTSGQTGGEAFLMRNGGMQVHMKVRTIDAGAFRRLADYWGRYGYSINRYTYIGGDIDLMTHYTYWKIKELGITAGRMPEQFKQTIRGIFEKGVTVWSGDRATGIGQPNWEVNNPKIRRVI